MTAKGAVHEVHVGKMSDLEDSNDCQSLVYGIEIEGKYCRNYSLVSYSLLFWGYDKQLAFRNVSPQHSRMTLGCRACGSIHNTGK